MASKVPCLLIAALALGIAPSSSSAALHRVGPPAAPQLLDVNVTAEQTGAVAYPGATLSLLALHVQNTYLSALTLKTLNLTNLTAGPGTQAQLDAELGTLKLYRDDGDGTFEPGQDSVQKTTVAASGVVRFQSLNAKITSGATVTFFVATTVGLPGRDGDVLDVSIRTSSDIQFDASASFRNGFPISPAGNFPIDGMTAAQIAVRAAKAAGVSPGSTRQLAFDVVLPADGYVPDVLARLGVTNLGSASAGSDITAMEAWVDDGDSTFDSQKDRRLGAMFFTGNEWTLTGSEPIPVGGLHVFLSVDVGASATEGHTVRLALPSSPSFGVVVNSPNTGPIDRAVENSSPLTISNADRVVMSAVTIPSASPRPGERDVPLLTLVAANNYGVPRTLSSLLVTNTTQGAGTLAQRDAEVQLLTLRADGDGDGRLRTDVDPVLGVSFFSGGQAAFSGFDWEIPAGRSTLLFVTADVSQTLAADGDQLGAVIEAPGSLVFKEPTALAAMWPLDSGAHWIIDGFVAAQMTLDEVPAAAVAPGDGPLLALRFTAPANGYASDTFRSLRVINLGSAGMADIRSMQLWRDGGDGRLSGDDVSLGALTPLGGGWQSPLLSEPLDPTGAPLLVSVTLDSAAAESSTIRLAVPVAGIENGSGNDGPLDHMVANSGELLVSSAALLATVSTVPASDVGQTVAVRMAVRNTGSEAVLGITPAPLEVSGDARLTLVTGPVPASFALAAGASDTVTWQLRADSTGDARFASSASGTGATSGLTRRSPKATSGNHHVYLPTDRLVLDVVQTMPTTVTRGQSDVVPFSFTFSNPGGGAASDGEIRGVKLHLEDDQGAPIVPSLLLSRVVVSEGTTTYLTKTTLESTGSEVDLPLNPPARVPGTQPTTLSIRLDILSSTSVPAFRVVVEDSAKITVHDAISGAPSRVVLATGQFPLRSDVAGIVSPATRLDVDTVASDSTRAGRGGPVTLLAARLENPGVSGVSSDVRIASFALGLFESAGTPLGQPADVLSRIDVIAGGLTLASRPVLGSDGAILAVSLSPPLNLPANSPLVMTVRGTVAGGALLGHFQARLSDSTQVDARDAVTHDPVAVHYQTVPVRGGWFEIQAVAETLLVRGTPLLPSVAIIGEDNLPTLAAVLRHGGASGTARIRIDSLTVELRDQSRRPLAPATYLSRIVVLWRGAQVGAFANLPASGGGVTLALPGLTLEPGDSAEARILIDVNPNAPAGALELMVTAAGLHAVDDNLNSPVENLAAPGSELPVLSGLALLQLPAHNLSVDLLSRMPAVLAPEGRPVDAGTLRLVNDDPGAASIYLDHLEIAGSDRDLAALAIGRMAARVEAYLGDSLWAASGPLTSDSTLARLVPADRLAIGGGQTVDLELRFVLADAPEATSLRLGCERSGVVVVQPSNPVLGVVVRPVVGRAFPLWTESGNLTGSGLTASYSNFPNPFAAGRQSTQFVYDLKLDARVTLRLLSARGEGVATLLSDVPRGAGLHQEDRWDGRNGRGEVVTNGVYVAELLVRYGDGTSERVLRKVGVVR